MVSVLAFDIGASSGRALVGDFDGHHLSVVETHRFPNDPARIHQHLYWDIFRLLHEVKQGILATFLQDKQHIQSIGIDTWGVDFGLLDARGELLGNPYHYRDAQTEGIMEEVLQILPRQEIFTRTGIQFVPFNTLYQLYALQKSHSPVLEHAATLLFIPELLRYFLTGEKVSEWTIASTSQLCSPYTRTWDRELLEKLHFPTQIFLDPVAPGTPVGHLHSSVCEEINVPSRPVIAVTEHDTGAAVVAVPAEQDDFAYLSCGTWSLLGTELTAPLVNEEALRLNVTNEGGFQNTSRLLKNVAGLWLLQECRRVWHTEGKQISYTDEILLATQAIPFRSFINPDHPMFLHPSHMPRQIQHYCRETGQPVPETEGALIRCILESLALRYRFVLEGIEQLVQKRFPGLHIVGGGTQNTALCQYTANALSRPVWAGPREATAIGNILVQMLSLHALSDIRHARRIVRESFPFRTYLPVDRDAWHRAYERFNQIIQYQ